MSIEDQIRGAEERWLDGWTNGPGKVRWTSLPVQIGDDAPDVELRGIDDEPESLSAFWQDGPALILFWRHYGCSCGIDRAQRLRSEYGGYREAGGNVVIVGQGEPERARAYAEKYGLPPCPILCDPEFRAYEAYGLLEGTPEQVFFDAPDELLRTDLRAGLRLMAERRDGGRPLVDNPWILPGEFVIDTSGTIRLAYRYQYCEGYPDPRVHTAALKRIRWDSPGLGQ